MAAVAQVKTASASATFSTSRVEHPDRFFGRVRTCLAANELPKALEILQSGNASIHRNLAGGNIEMMKTFLSVEKETAEKTSEIRCSRLTRVIQQHFPDVFQLEAIKMKGIEAGLSMEEVEGALSQVVLKDGSFWVIGTTHNDKYDAWENSLIGLAGSNKINLWNEGTVRNSTIEAAYVKSKTSNSIATRGQFRGIENWETAQCALLLVPYLDLFDRGNIGMVIQYPFLNQLYDKFYTLKLANFLRVGAMGRNLWIEWLRSDSNELGTNVFSGTLATASDKCPLALEVLKGVMALANQEVPLEHYMMFAMKMFQEEGDLRNWLSFFEETMSSALKQCRNCPKEVDEAFQDLVASAKKYLAMFKQMPSPKKEPKTHEELIKFHEKTAASSKEVFEKAARESGFFEQREKFLAAFRPVRDEVFADSFFSEWPNRNKDVISVVVFGNNHVPGFKKEVFARQDGKLESKAEKKDDEKNDNRDKGDKKGPK